jgi:hypothetical protein
MPIVARIFAVLNLVAGVLTALFAGLLAASHFYADRFGDALRALPAEQTTELGALKLIVWSGDLERLLTLGALPTLLWAVAFIVAAHIWRKLAAGDFAAVQKPLLFNFVLSLAAPLFSAFSGLNAHAVDLLKATPANALSFAFVAIVSPDPRWNLDNLLRPNFFGNGALVLAAVAIVSVRLAKRAVVRPLPVGNPVP